MPASPDRLVLLRSIRAVRGEARVSVLLDARPGFGAQGCRAPARTIGDEVRSRCPHGDGHWQRAEDDESVDAALLMAFVRRCAAPTGTPADGGPGRRSSNGSPRTAVSAASGTAMAELGEEEGRFLLCGYMMAMAEPDGGDRVDDFRWFERMRAACGPTACSPRSTTWEPVLHWR